MFHVYNVIEPQPTSLIAQSTLCKPGTLLTLTHLTLAEARLPGQPAANHNSEHYAILSFMTINAYFLSFPPVKYWQFFRDMIDLSKVVCIENNFQLHGS